MDAHEAPGPSAASTRARYPAFRDLLRRAAALDLDDANYATSSERMGLFTYLPMAPWRRTPMLGALAFLAKGLVALARGRGGRVTPGASALFAVGSSNQWQAIAPVAERMTGSTTLALHPKGPGTPFPFAEAYLWSVPFLARTLRLRARATGYRRIGYDRAFDRYWFTHGFYVAAARTLARARPAAVVVANDHTMESRVIRMAAQDLGIPTAYVQHASVSPAFPPLAFDVAFLDGADAATKYDQPHAGEPPLALLAGIPKADPVRRHRTRATVMNRIGVCVNVLDPLDRVTAFIADLREAAPNLRIVLRPHPSDERPWASTAPAVDRLSNASEEPSFRFLASVDAIVAGASNIVLEAALAGVPAVCFDFAERSQDPYGFVANGLAPSCASASDVVQRLRGFDTARQETALRRYCATVGTAFDGRSAELVAEALAELAQGSPLRPGRWHEAPGYRYLDAYELRAAPQEVADAGPQRL